MKTPADFKGFYKSQSTIQLVENYLGGGLSETALPLLIAELESRGLNPNEITKETLDKLLKDSGVAKPPSPLRGIKNLAEKKPYLFALFLLGAWILINDWIPYQVSLSQEDRADNIPGLGAFCWGLEILLGLALLWFLGWLKPLLISFPFKWRTILIVFFFTAYQFNIISLNGQESFGSIPDYYHEHYDPDTSFADWWVFPFFYYIASGLGDAYFFNGIVLICFLRVWGDSKYGVIKSVLIASLFVGVSFWIRGFFPAYSDRDMEIVFYIVLSTFLSGLVYGAMLIFARNLWIPIIYHAIYNYLAFHPALEHDLSSYMSLAIINAPLAICSIILILKTPLWSFDSKPRTTDEIVADFR